MITNTQAIWESFSQDIKAFILKRVDDQQDAEDLLQEVFIKIHTHIDTLQDEQRLAPWLYQIARNAIIDYYRSRRIYGGLPEALVEVNIPESSDPTKELASGLGAMIASLPDKYRQVLLLSEIEGLKQKEVAERLGMTLSGTKSRVQRGRNLLRQALLDCCHFEFDRRGHVIDYTPRPDCCPNCETAG